MAPTDAVLDRLDPARVGELVHLAIDHLLDQPVAELVTAGWLADQLVEAIRQATANPATEAWLLSQLELLRDLTPEGSLGARVSPAVAEPIRQLLQQPMVLERPLAERLLQHDAVGALLSFVVMGALQGFAKKLRPTVPVGRSLGQFKALQRLGDLSHQLEQKGQQRIESFVEESMGLLIAQVADHLTDPANATIYGTFRGHLFDATLTTPFAEVLAEVDKFGMDNIVSAAMASLRALAEHPEFHAALAAAIEQGRAEFGTRSLRHVLEESGLAGGVDAWRAELESPLVTSASTFVKTPAFRAWLRDVLEDGP